MMSTDMKTVLATLLVSAALISQADARPRVSPKIGDDAKNGICRVDPFNTDYHYTIPLRLSPAGKIDGPNAILSASEVQVILDIKTVGGVKWAFVVIGDDADTARGWVPESLIYCWMHQ
jgi:hypothetical protein